MSSCEIRESGEWFGYPKCCIDAYIEGGDVEGRKLDGTGYVPCAACDSEKSEAELVAEIDRNREYFLPFPMRMYGLQAVPLDLKDRIISYLECYARDNFPEHIAAYKKKLPEEVAVRWIVSDVYSVGEPSFTVDEISVGKRSPGGVVSYERAKEIGAKFGYPECCLEVFGMKEEAFEPRKLWGTGYRPCQVCHDAHTIDELVGVINARRSPSLRLPFPLSMEIANVLPESLLKEFLQAMEVTIREKYADHLAEFTRHMSEENALCWLVSDVFYCGEPGEELVDLRFYDGLDPIENA